MRGPYAPFEGNPILTQRNLDPHREHPVTCTGHADLVETVSGEWWGVFLGCRPYPPYERGYYNTGRETFIAPVRWKNDWPAVDPEHAQIQFRYPLRSDMGVSGQVPRGGNVLFRDDFSGSSLGAGWLFLRTPRESWHSLSERAGFLTMRVRPETCDGPGNPSFLGHRQQHTNGYASLSLDFLPETENEKAGLLLFQSERHYYYLCKSLAGGKPAVQLYQGGPDAGHPMKLLAEERLEGASMNAGLMLKAEARGSRYAFFYAAAHGSWRLLKDSVDASYLSTKVAGGFVGSLYAMYATSLGAPSGNRASFDWFEAAGNDDLYGTMTPVNSRSTQSQEVR